MAGKPRQRKTSKRPSLKNKPIKSETKKDVIIPKKNDTTFFFFIYPVLALVAAIFVNNGLSGLHLRTSAANLPLQFLFVVNVCFNCKDNFLPKNVSKLDQFTFSLAAGFLGGAIKQITIFSLPVFLYSFQPWIMNIAAFILVDLIYGLTSQKASFRLLLGFIIAIYKFMSILQIARDFSFASSFITYFQFFTFCFADMFASGVAVRLISYAVFYRTQFSHVFFALKDGTFMALTAVFWGSLAMFAVTSDTGMEHRAYWIFLVILLFKLHRFSSARLQGFLLSFFPTV